MAAKVSKGENLTERRDGVRADRVVEVRHRLLKRKGRRQDSRWSASFSKNMSVGGLLFLSPVAYQVGDVIELEVVLSGVIDIYKGLAQVVRIHESSTKSFDVAAKYVEVKFKLRSAKSHYKK